MSLDKFRILVEKCFAEMVDLPALGNTVILVNDRGKPDQVAELKQQIISGVRLPDTITLFKEKFMELPKEILEENIKSAIRHEVYHRYGLSHAQMRERRSAA